MVSDRVIGAGILVISVIVMIIYLIGLLLVPLFPNFFPEAINWLNDLNTQLWLIRIPILAAIFALGAIAAWIGWTILTTPPPKPIEEIQKEIEEASKEAEKKES